MPIQTFSAIAGTTARTINSLALQDFVSARQAASTSSSPVIGEQALPTYPVGVDNLTAFAARLSPAKLSQAIYGGAFNYNYIAHIALIAASELDANLLVGEDIDPEKVAGRIHSLYLRDNDFRLQRLSMHFGKLAEVDQEFFRAYAKTAIDFLRGNIYAFDRIERAALVAACGASSADIMLGETRDPETIARRTHALYIWNSWGNRDTEVPTQYRVAFEKLSPNCVAKYGAYGNAASAIINCHQVN